MQATGCRTKSSSCSYKNEQQNSDVSGGMVDTPVCVSGSARDSSAHARHLLSVRRGRRSDPAKEAVEELCTEQL